MITSKAIKLNKIKIPFHTGQVKMLPFDLSDLNAVPDEFIRTVKEMVSQLPNLIGRAFLTIDGKFVSKSKTFRRGAPHIDGNYIEEICGWGSGGGNGWKIGENGPAITTEYHKLSYQNLNGGMLIASNYSACKGWVGEYEGAANVGGDCRHINLKDGFILKADTVYYGNSQFIHESLPLDKDVFRVLYRITLPIDYKY